MPDSKLGGHYSPLTLSPRDRQSGHTQHHCPPEALWRPLALLGLVSAACHGCTPRRRLWSKEGHGLGGRGWPRIGKGIPVLTVHALLKVIPAREGQVKSFQFLLWGLEFIQSHQSVWTPFEGCAEVGGAAPCWISALWVGLFGNGQDGRAKL